MICGSPSRNSSHASITTPEAQVGAGQKTASTNGNDEGLNPSQLIGCYDTWNREGYVAPRCNFMPCRRLSTALFGNWPHRHAYYSQPGLPPSVPRGGCFEGYQTSNWCVVHGMAMLMDANTPRSETVPRMRLTVCRADHTSSASYLPG